MRTVSMYQFTCGSQLNVLANVALNADWFDDIVEISGFFLFGVAKTSKTFNF